MELGDCVLCDRCADRFISAKTGWPGLPDRPPPEEIVGPDDVPHLMTYRLFRGPSGITATAEEEDPLDEGGGYALRVFGTHDCSPQQLVAALRVKVRQEIGCHYLSPHPRGRGWLIEKELAAGRLVWDKEEEKPFGVVIDGRRLSWEEFGKALELYEGSEFRLELLPNEVLAHPH